jgi:hypothetical protein
VRFLRVTGWEDFQHYKNRRAPWIKVATDLLDQLEHPTFTKLSDGAKLTLHHLRLLAGVTGNRIPESWLTPGHLNMLTKPRVTELAAAQFVEWFEESAASSLADSPQSEASADAPKGAAVRARGRAHSPVSPDSHGSSPGEAKQVLRTGARELIEAFAVTEKHRAWAAEHAPDVDIESATEHWRDYNRANGYRTRQGPVRDADGSWRTWIRNEVKFSRGRNGNSGTANRRAETRTGAGGAAATPRKERGDDGLNVRPYVPRGSTGGGA